MSEGITDTSNSNFLTYTNADYGFTIKYPSDWKVDDSEIARFGVRFMSPDKAGNLGVIVSYLRPNETGMSPNDMEKRLSMLVSHQPPGLKLTEMNTNNYFLSGHPAIRLIGIMSLGGPGEPGASEGIVGTLKTMGLITITGAKEYTVTYAAIPPERFPDYLQTAQIMIDSFQIITKQ
jgi:hypothetical protein